MDLLSSQPTTDPPELQPPIDPPKLQLPIDPPKPQTLMDPPKPQPPMALSPQDTNSEKGAGVADPQRHPLGGRPSLAKYPRTSSQYVEMLLHQEKIPRLYNILAGFFTWILLAGFVLLPGTFSSFQNDSAQVLQGATGVVEKGILTVVKDIPLFAVAFACCGIGAIGMLYLWWKWANNYVWLVNKLFMPGTLNSLTGIITTLVNVYGAQHREFSTTSKVTIIVTGAATLICGTIALVYSVWKLRSVKRQHEVEDGGENTDGVAKGCLDFLWALEGY